ncbi:demethoxyubiquinone hydroxylase family protein [Papillibacter cinnamivorans]|uniref:Ubiquinone biosynthesis protein COQ7 n=1 Tax=Papillibacter cinnamivorans DSM 12816 TaxID=1122930 RepID=A0A1W1YJU5_9FIRM|nr:demethoxyubiquinone hydroxylase family protein [Papillibacter cinnamivorans]SMC36424.1 Ubiquinone biosynthesis protein COQ7 [Papillibacter cinnamivorans DSM 12816]
MALLGNPFVANVSKQMSPDELIQAIRVDIAGELEAIIGYEAHAMSTGDERVKKVLYHIADEERQHVGELQQLLYILCPKEMDYTEKGKQAIILQQQQNFQTPLQ